MNTLSETEVRDLQPLKREDERPWSLQMGGHPLSPQEPVMMMWKQPLSVVVINAY